MDSILVEGIAVKMKNKPKKTCRYRVIYARLIVLETEVELDPADPNHPEFGPLGFDDDGSLPEPFPVLAGAVIRGRNGQEASVLAVKDDEHTWQIELVEDKDHAD